ncbi:hypothetical protein HA052_21415 [Chromobacterium haemolyticum]|uniref:Peptidase C58 YopT-type domain-containing protein n=1 Tax=Chromobacterium fluminis TaxID=3044269 RepID=A0ABX0LET5_9NEIS|nr:YopT-type cysteine protease domain-containing protein [Chromobacterium haemolyticum]NHR07753.1 hypothetical protein [Chromobacterium haemolyticum]
MSTIQTAIQLRAPQYDLSSLQNINEPTRIGMRKDGMLVLYTGRSYLLHPDQTRRARDFLRDRGALPASRPLTLSTLLRLRQPAPSPFVSPPPAGDRASCLLLRSLLRQQNLVIREELSMLQNAGLVTRAKQGIAQPPEVKTDAPFPQTMPPALLRRFNMVGVVFERPPANYAELLSGIQASGRPEQITVAERKLRKTDLAAPPKPGKVKSLLAALARQSNDAWAQCARAHGGAQARAFRQAEFIQGSTIGEQGVCFPLAVKWLASQRSWPGDAEAFFRDIETAGGREEVMELAVNSYVWQNADAVADYFAVYGLIPRSHSESPGFKFALERDGLYNIGIQPAQGVGHAVAARVDHAARTFRFFDPNSGEYALPSAEALAGFAQDYLALAYPSLDKDSSVMRLA